MRTDEDLSRLIRTSFHQQTSDVIASPDLARDVRRQLNRRRTGIAAMAGAGVVAASAVGAVAAGSTHGGPTAAATNSPQGKAVSGSVAAASKSVQLASFKFRVPATAKVSKSCLPGSRQYLAGPSPRGYVQLLVRARASSPEALDGRCIGATISFTQSPGAPTGQVTTAGQPTVYLIASRAGTQAGYIELGETASANAAAAVGGPPGTYYEVFTLPADSSRSVLVAGLRQYRPAG